MIAHLSGTLLAKAPQSVIIENGGIGYEVTVPLSTFYTLPEKDGKVSLHIYTHVREDALMLFGFYTPLEKEIFTMLISVSGIGPKLATNILSGIGPEELLAAMARGDTARMQSIPGIGKKTSERIALELRDKAMKLKGTLEPLASQVLLPEEKGMLDDAASALVNLGYSAKLARDAVEKARTRLETFNLQLLIKEALKVLA
ncbi:MAG: Holliday junction helicase RuvA [Deltaproteobacteria bacterium]|jgi:Holliday junction DNA helicase RuvA|nr:Holliday junction helicase RuvA [Deltaproteobacteria bacterium]